MKKTVIILIAMLVVCSLLILPVSAANSIKVALRPDEDGNITSGGTVCESCEVGCLKVTDGNTVVVDKGVTVTVKNTMSIAEDSAVKILGTLVLDPGCTVENSGTVNVVCCGKLDCGTQDCGNTVSPVHVFEGSGKCIYCGSECKHENVMTFCTDCGTVLQNGNSGDGISFNLPEGETVGTVGGPISGISGSPIKTVSGQDVPTGFAVRVNTASVLSEGDLTIVVGIAAAVVFGIGGFLIGRRNRKTVSAGGDE